MAIHTLIEPAAFHLFIILASLIILLKSADLLIYGITNYAKKLGLSDAIIGLIVIGMAASSPEVVSSLTGFLKGNEAVGLGAILGSNMVHAGLAIGVIALIGKKVNIEPNIFTKQRLLMWVMLMLPLVMAIDGKIDRTEGGFLLICFFSYLAILWHIEGSLGKLKKNVKLKRIWKDSAIFLGCLAAIILAGRFLVGSSIELANILNIPAFFVAVIIVGIGTTLPDFVIEIKAVLKKHAAIGLGDLLGSLVIELLLFIGLVSLIRPLTFNPAIAINAIICLAASITLIMIFLRNRSLSWKHGLALISVFIIFLTIEIIKIA